MALDPSDQPASTTTDSFALVAAAMVQAISPARPVGSARGTSRSSAQGRHRLPYCSRPAAQPPCRRRLPLWLPCSRSARTPLCLAVHPGSEAMLWFARILDHQEIGRAC